MTREHHEMAVVVRDKILKEIINLDTEKIEVKGEQISRNFFKNN